jgi:hypothetical protein
LKAAIEPVDGLEAVRRLVQPLEGDQDVAARAEQNGILGRSVDGLADPALGRRIIFAVIGHQRHAVPGIDVFRVFLQNRRQLALRHIVFGGGNGLVDPIHLRCQIRHRGASSTKWRQQYGNNRASDL